MHRIGRLGLALVGAMFCMTPAAPAGAVDTLAIPITRGVGHEHVPIELQVEVVRVQLPRSSAAEEVALPHHSVVVPDGQRVHLQALVATPRGERRFEVSVVPRHHPDAIEVEWDLEVYEALYRPIGLVRYVRHRLALDESLDLGPQHLRIARSDIAITRGGVSRVTFEIDEERFEIRILAAKERV